MIASLIEEDLEFVDHLVAKSGPTLADYPVLENWFNRIRARAAVGEISSDQLLELRRAFGEAMSPATLQGFVCAQPHGYHGDFEIIDKIYVRHISPVPRLMRWDAYFHAQPAPKAVRNRKNYFHRLLDHHYARRQPLRVLKLAIGPGRSMFEWLSAHPDAEIFFDCIEMDPIAITYAAALNEEFTSRIAFTQKNVVKFRPEHQYDLIWAAGLFDYFSDKIFRAVLGRLLPAIAADGELIVGNFSPNNRSRGYMEFGGWKLHHRSAEALVSLALACGASAEKIHVGAEPEGVNLFLHLAG